MRLPSWNWRSLKNMFKRQPGFSNLKMKKSYFCKLYLSFYVGLQYYVNPFPDYFLQQNHCFEQNHSNGKMQAYKCIEPSRSALKAAVLLSIVKYVQGPSYFQNLVKIVIHAFLFLTKQQIGYNILVFSSQSNQLP